MFMIFVKVCWGGGEYVIIKLFCFVFLGYINEVGEVFRVQVFVRLVYLSYVVVSGYVVVDVVYKGWEVLQVMCQKEMDRQINVYINRERERERISFKSVYIYSLYLFI